ncbi:hypothetical protein SEA_YARA_58 [Streptomyces phage Yara]|nr:hypothetical protein SEA_YARA_58 [Streptomyces phage Yara]
MASLSKQPFVPETVAVNYNAIANLTPADGENDMDNVEVIEMGVGWDKSTGGSGGLLGWVNRKVGSDLDGVAVAYVNGRPIKYLGWDELDCFAPEAPGAAVHSGDNQTGEGDGDDETIRLELARIPQRFDKLVLVATAFKPGSSMKRAKNITVTLYDSTGGTKTPVGWIEPSLLNPKNTLGVAVLTRKGNSWTLRVLESSFDVKQGDRDDFLRKVAGL